eukprot:TRINITY_DN5354_c0_g2_i1.p1 TRINITY_DN5354_c0_g2~~TRINITY_DN5354_c0_g2_i1.p1  ORF type:complete len:561 (+),score=88.92 TRINITY_DN5354_c0_g2_i1:147-1829(+)
MQPLVYVAVRALLGWLQFCERGERAFLHNHLVLLAAGVLHSWAAVYSLFTAVHTRAMRVDGYHEGYIEHLPASVSLTEWIAQACFLVWIVAGITIAVVQILDDSPVLGDSSTDIFAKIVRSPYFQAALKHVHSISCAGLFVSILMLCWAVVAMKGSITVCELCLVLVSLGFALPHALLAIRRLNDVFDRIVGACLPDGAAEAAVAEAAAFGPLLCIILGLADSPGHAYLWQNVIYILASGSFLFSVAACCLRPPKDRNTALPPESSETFACLLMDAMAAVVIVWSFPAEHNTLFFWGLFVAVVGSAVAMAVGQKDVKEFYMEWIEQIFVLREDRKVMVDEQRQRVQLSARVIAIMCGLTAVWDLAFHEVPHAGDMYGPPPDWSDIMMLRWKSAYAGNTSGPVLLEAVAKAHGVESSTLEELQRIEWHRLLLFKTRQNATEAETNKTKANWAASVAKPEGALADIIEQFPTALDFTMCAVARNQTGDKSANHLAFSAACAWMQQNMAMSITMKHLLLEQQVKNVKFDAPEKYQDMAGAEASEPTGATDATPATDATKQAKA